MLEEVQIARPDVAVNQLQLTESLAALKQVLEDSQFFRKRPRPVGLPPVLSDVEKVGVSAFEEQHQRLLVGVDPIHKGIVQGQEEGPVLFAYLFLVDPHLLEPLLELSAVIAAKGDDPETVLHPSHIVLD
jgi:hypothetical protein